MESFPVQFCRAIRSQWRRRKYKKLRSGNNAGAVIRLGDRRGPRRRFRLRSLFKIRIQAFSPARILARIRDAYVDAMLGMAGKGTALAAGPEVLQGRRIPKSRPVRPEPGEFEKRLILEIYKSVMTSKEFAIEAA